MKKTSIVILATLTTLFCYAKTEKLALNLQKGETYTQVQFSKMAINQTINGEENTILMNISGKTTYRVLDVVNSVYDLEVKFASLSMSMSMQNQQFEFSSEKNDPNDIVSSVFNKMKNKPFRIKLSQEGKVIEITELNSLYKEVFDSFPTLADQQKEQIKAQITQSFGEDAIKGNIEMITAIFPSKPVELGEKWTCDTQLRTTVKAKVKSTYELSEIADNYYIIKGTSAIATDKNEEPSTVNGMPVKYDLKGTTISSFKINKKTGWTSNAETNQSITGMTHILNTPQIPGGISIPMTIKVESTYTE